MSGPSVVGEAVTAGVAAVNGAIGVAVIVTEGVAIGEVLVACGAGRPASSARQLSTALRNAAF